MHQAPIIATAGEILVEFISHQKNCQLQHIAQYSGPYPSGAPAIFLDQVARMGSSTQLFGGVGHDGFGRSVVSRLQDDRVGIEGVQLQDNFSTGCAFVSYYDDGQRDFIFHIENTACDHFVIPDGIIDPANTWLHVSGASLGNKRMRAVILDFVAQVANAGGKIFCDPNARPELIRDTAAIKALHEVIACSFCLMPSTSDLGVLFPELSPAEAINRLLESNAEMIALKKGAEGATVFAQDQRFEFSGHRVKEIDPTGAGDCFCGTFIALLAQGIDVEQAGKMANAAGAIAVTRRGPMEGNASPEEISQFLAQQTTQELSA